MPKFYMFYRRVWVFLNLFFRFGMFLHQAYSWGEEGSRDTIISVEFVFDGLDYSANQRSGFLCLPRAIWAASEGIDELMGFAVVDK
jgi:hypothetical protein